MVLGKHISADFLKEVESNILAYNTALIVRCFVLDIINQCWDADPLKRPNADELYELIGGLLSDIRHNRVDSVIYKQVKETDDINKKLSFSSPLLKSTDLPEPTNADNNDDLLGMEYSDSLKMDFTKLDINSKDENN
ncbi:kinase-like domain-containing protein [Rhizophagus irregularis DAOM 181602=DAOM 197198]|nr:kinase-like domain-containing protein [Rhizophagus irregularis DAOM 181602=DAOM 197198]